MFDPNAVQQSKAEKAAKNKALKKLKEWALDIIPIELQDGLVVDIKEM